MLKDDKMVDAYDLVNEWSRQPKLYDDYNKAATNARKVRDLFFVKVEVAKTKMKRQEGLALIDAKTNPNKYGLEKSTDTLCQAAAINSYPYKQAFGKYIRMKILLADAEKDLSFCEGALTSMIDRRKTLDGFTSLWINQYYGSDLSSDRKDALGRDSVVKAQEESLKQSTRLVRRKHGSD